MSTSARINVLFRALDIHAPVKISDLPRQSLEDRYKLLKKEETKQRLSNNRWKEKNEIISIKKKSAYEEVYKFVT